MLAFSDRRFVRLLPIVDEPIAASSILVVRFTRPYTSSKLANSKTMHHRGEVQRFRDG